MLAEARFCMGAKAGARAGLQTYDMFAITWFANYDMFASRSTRIARLANILYVCKHAVDKDIICLQAMQHNTLFICRGKGNVGGGQQRGQLLGWQRQWRQQQGCQAMDGFGNKVGNGNSNEGGGQRREQAQQGL
jgi:hypothetical protein